MKNSKGSKTQVLQQQLEAEIKARQQLEIALQERQSHWRDLFHLSPIGMVEISLEGKFLEVNSSFCKFVGYSQAELIEFQFNRTTFHFALKDHLIECIT